MSAKQKLIDLVNRDNPGLNLAVSDVDFSTAIDNPDSGVMRDTRLTLTSKNFQRFKGPATVWYNRIDMTRIFGENRVFVLINHEKGDLEARYYTTDLVAPLNLRFGLDLQEEDVVVTALTHVDGVGEVDLFIKPDNVAWKGRVKIMFSGESQDLENVIVNATLFGFNYPNSDLSKGQAAVYSYSALSAENDNAYWSALSIGALPDTVEGPFNRCDNTGKEWVFVDGEVNEYNLAGSAVLYNGSNSQSNLIASFGVMTNPNYPKVCIFSLSDTLCSNFGGKMTVYYR